MRTKVYKAAIFDMDGMILNTLDDLVASMNYVLEKTGHRHDLAIRGAIRVSHGDVDYFGTTRNKLQMVKLRQRKHISIEKNTAQTLKEKETSQ